MKHSSLLAVVALAVLSNAAPTDTTRHVLHEKRSTTPRRWQRGQRVHEDAILPIKIGLTQSNLDDGYGLLMDVRNSGKQWNSEQVAEHFAPAEEVSNASTCL